MKIMFAILVGYFLTCALGAKGQTVVDKDKVNNYTVTEEAWFEVEVKDYLGPGQPFKGRFEIALFGDSAPMTVMNFVNIVKGYKRGKQAILHYKNTPVHRIVKDFVIQMGDVTAGDGTGGASIYGEKFNDEQFILSHRAPGMVSMANKGKDTNGSQFFIIMVPARWMDGKHVVFGKVIRGYKNVKTINEVNTIEDSSWPAKKIRIVDCGVNNLAKKYVLTEEQVDSVADLPKQ